MKVSMKSKSLEIFTITPLLSCPCAHPPMLICVCHKDKRAWAAGVWVIAVKLKGGMMHVPNMDGPWGH